MAKNTGPVAKVENKSGSVSTARPIPANVGTPTLSGLNAPKSERASGGYRIKDGGIGATLDARHTRGREGLFGNAQAGTGFTARSIPNRGVNRPPTGQTKEVAIGRRPSNG